MNNSDVAGIDASRRLAKVWPHKPYTHECCWSHFPDAPDADWDLVDGRETINNEAWGCDIIPAQSLGKMGDEIRRRGWWMVVALERRSDGTWEYVVTLLERSRAVHEREADARANALAEAIEKEGGEG